MKTIWTAMSAGAIALLLAGCGTSPTAEPAALGAAPRYDGAFGMGSGSRQSSSDSTMSATSSADTTAKGGYTIGSGG